MFLLSVLLNIEGGLFIKQVYKGTGDPPRCKHRPAAGLLQGDVMHSHHRLDLWLSVNHNLTCSHLDHSWNTRVSVSSSCLELH